MPMPPDVTSPLLTESGLLLSQLPSDTPGICRGTALPPRRTGLSLPVKPPGCPTYGANVQHPPPLKNSFIPPGTRPQTVLYLPPVGSPRPNSKGGIPPPLTNSIRPLPALPSGPQGSNSGGVLPPSGPKLPLPPKSPGYPKALSGAQPPLTPKNPSFLSRNVPPTLSPVQPIGSSSLAVSSMPPATQK
ncbi:hypothetical protein QYM36_015920 [Artemia franciscana]|uniref:Uncharacterized protein n=1 Tax=Artemia franciscana TaxID=6661 RepID=A0AA88L2T5_ARTSF|nr:hypothetical protein QYM36_015920 [Artemia franciscana]